MLALTSWQVPRMFRRRFSRMHAPRGGPRTLHERAQVRGEMRDKNRLRADRAVKLSVSRPVRRRWGALLARVVRRPVAAPKPSAQLPKDVLEMGDISAVRRDCR